VSYESGFTKLVSEQLVRTPETILVATTTEEEVKVQFEHPNVAGNDPSICREQLKQLIEGVNKTSRVDKEPNAFELKVKVALRFLGYMTPNLIPLNDS
jgi:hypothetical protein